LHAGPLQPCYATGHVITEHLPATPRWVFKNATKVRWKVMNPTDLRLHAVGQEVADFLQHFLDLFNGRLLVQHRLDVLDDHLTDEAQVVAAAR